VWLDARVDASVFFSFSVRSEDHIADHIWTRSGELVGRLCIHLIWLASLVLLRHNHFKSIFSLAPQSAFLLEHSEKAEINMGGNGVDRAFIDTNNSSHFIFMQETWSGRAGSLALGRLRRCAAGNPKW
jgi:hypothetical protein